MNNDELESLSELFDVDVKCIVEAFNVLTSYINEDVVPAIRKLYEELQEAGIDFDELTGRLDV